MLYKSVRSSSKSWFSPSISLTALSLGALLWADSSWASLSIGPVGLGNTALSNGDGYGNAYYPTTLTGVDTGDASVPPQVPTETQYTDQSGARALLFNLTGNTATYTPPANSNVTFTPYIMAFVQSNQSTTSNNFYPVPLAFYNTAPGGGGTYQSCQNNCYLTGTGYSGYTPPNTYYFAVPYTPKATVQVGIYPSDICALYAGTYLTSGAGTSCQGSAASGDGRYEYPIAANQSQGFNIKFVVALIPTGTISTIDPQHWGDTSLAGTANGINFTPDSGALFLSFQNAGGSINTPSCPAQLNLYFPGDQSIYLNTQPFQTLFQAPPLTGTGKGAAPLNSILMTYTTQPTPFPISASPPAFSINNVIARNIPLGNTDQLVTGFTNTTQDHRVFYSLGIYIRDDAGFVTSSACPLNNVQSAEIQGFLKESKCFIATAAFRSMDAAPVAMLRQFRDQVLLNSSLGRDFVDWYYRWSPPAAEWLIDHPGFRYPVLLALVPVEIIAWLCLRPMVFLFFAVACLTLFLALRKRMLGTPRGESL